jgi:hypothetical protein
MTPKRPNIPVAVPNDDGSSTIVGSEELRAAAEAHETIEAKISADAHAERLITNYLNGKRPTALQLLFHLALAEHYGRPIPAGLIRPIALAIWDAQMWSKEKNARRKKKTRKKEDSWDAKAAQLLRLDPNLKPHALGRQIARPGVKGESVRSVRRYFERKK